MSASKHECSIGRSYQLYWWWDPGCLAGFGEYGGGAAGTCLGKYLRAVLGSWMGVARYIGCGSAIFLQCVCWRYRCFTLQSRGLSFVRPFYTLLRILSRCFEVASKFEHTADRQLTWQVQLRQTPPLGKVHSAASASRFTESQGCPAPGPSPVTRPNL